MQYYSCLDIMVMTTYVKYVTIKENIKEYIKDIIYILNPRPLLSRCL